MTLKLYTNGDLGVIKRENSENTGTKDSVSSTNKKLNRWLAKGVGNGGSGSAGDAQKTQEEFDVWNKKNIKGKRSVFISKGPSYEAIVSEGEWTNTVVDSVDLSDVVPQKRLFWLYKFATYSVDQIRTIEYGQFQDYDLYEYDAIYDLNNGNVENILYDYGSRQYVETISKPLGNITKTVIESRTCWHASFGCD